MKWSAALVFVLLLAAFEGLEAPARILGQMVARVDLSRGQYRTLSVGLPARWKPEYDQLLRERYAIEDRRVAGCMVTRSLLAYVGGYNTVAMNAANQKFGHDIFEESRADAITIWQARRAASAQ